MSRMLAHVEKVVRVFPIAGADFIEGVQILGWECVAKKGEFKEGDLCVYVEIDSIVPPTPMFEFLKDRNYRIKTIKLKKQVSQGLALPIEESMGKVSVGDDLTEALGITKYLRPSEREEDDTPLPKSGMGWFARFMYRFFWFRWLYGKVFPKPTRGFPEWIGKTDEERIQNNPERYLSAKGPLYESEKLDGQSATYAIERRRGFMKKHEFVVCSRNNRMGVGSKGSWRYVAEKYDIEKKLIAILADSSEDIQAIALQGENIGPGIQGNKYKRDDYEFYVFNMKYKLSGKTYDQDLDELLSTCAKHGLNTVPILDKDFWMMPTLQDMLKHADGDSVLAKTDREGVVIRSHDMGVSFKVVSNKFLLKGGEE